MATWPGVGPVTPSVLSAFFFPEIYKSVSVATNQSNAHGTANLALYYPVLLPAPITVTKAWWQNGITVSGNTDVGIYDAEGNRYISTGSTLQAGVSAIQSVDITDTLIPAGLMYLAIASSSNTATYWGTAGGYAGPSLVAYSAYIQTTACPLPNPATFATGATAGFGMHKFGFLVAPRTVL